MSTQSTDGPTQGETEASGIEAKVDVALHPGKGSRAPSPPGALDTDIGADGDEQQPVK